jgi:hypothetical protein
LITAQWHTLPSVESESDVIVRRWNLDGSQDATFSLSTVKPDHQNNVNTPLPLRRSSYNPMDECCWEERS